MKFMLFYDVQTGQVKECIPAVKFTKGQDNMGVHCMGLNERILPGVELTEQQALNSHSYRVCRDHGFGDSVGKLELISDADKIVIYNREKIQNVPWLFLGHFLTGTGYARFTRQFINRFIERDFPFKMLDQSNPTFETVVGEELLSYRKHWISVDQIRKDDNFIYMGFHPPTMKYPPKKYNIVFTMLESYTIEPPFYKVMDASYDKFIVPTQFVKGVFSQYIDPNRLDIVPLGIDPSIFHPGIERQQSYNFKKVDLESEKILPTDEKPSGYKFMSLSRFSHRKGCDLVLKAFCHEFTAKDDVSLVLFFLPEDEKRILKLHSDMLKILKKYSAGKRLPPIYCVDKPWPEEKTALPYAWGDCFVFPSRGEGFGLPPLEAAACGLPVIATNCSGMSDFVSDDVCFPIEPDFFDNIGRMSGQRYLYMGKYPDWRHDYFHPHTFNTVFPIMNSPEVIANIGEKMRYVWEHHDSEDVQGRVKRFHDLILEKYTWNLNFEKLYGIVKGF